MGAKPYTQVKNLDITGAIIEIGSERSEGSTTFLYNFAKANNFPFYTVDFNKEQYFNALRITNGHGAYNMSGEEFLGNIFPLLGEKISFAYLDNFDLITNDGRDWEKRKALYKQYGFDMTNTNSKIAHMTQAVLIEKYQAKTCHIIFDDTWIDSLSKEFQGKGAWAIRPLQHAKFKIQNNIFVGSEIDGLKNGFVLMSKINK
ncbi:MAG: hypothetical protein NTU97_02390 [Candidatus Magasanikbacteria bacterium]|nr:hypothetical protein [Candidatus Magasanikbacteria bacterium]